MMGTIAIKLLMALVTESFIKRVVVTALEYAAKQSENDVDDKLVAEVKRAWSVE